MKEEILKLYKQFKDEFNQYERDLYGRGGSWSRNPDFEEFMEWLENGFIS